MGRELALPYVPIEPGIDRHPKTRKLLRLLGRQDDPRGHWPLVQWLLAVGDMRPDGDLTGLGDDDHADMARETGDPHVWAQALRDAGWIGVGDKGPYAGRPDQLVGWFDYGGRVLEQRQAWRDQKHRQRGAATNNQQLSEQCPPDIPRTPADVSGIPLLKVNGEGEGEQAAAQAPPRAAADSGAIASIPELELAASAAGLVAGNIGARVIRKARAIIDAGPIGAHEWRAALKALAEHPEVDPPRRLSWVLGAVDVERRAAAEEARKPRSGPVPAPKPRAPTKMPERAEWSEDGAERARAIAAEVAAKLGAT